jgi:hypothetical protein
MDIAPDKSLHYDTELDVEDTCRKSEGPNSGRKKRVRSSSCHSSTRTKLTNTRIGADDAPPGLRN